jgi:hypothetical protein
MRVEWKTYITDLDIPKDWSIEATTMMNCQAIK